MSQKQLLSYHRKNSKKNRQTIAGMLSGQSRFAKIKKSEASTSAAAASTSAAAASSSTTAATAATAAKTPPRTLTEEAATSTTEEAATSTTEEAATSRPTTPLRTLTEIAEMSRPRSTTPMIIIGSGPPSPQITSKKRRKTTKGVEEIGDDGKFSKFFEKF
jgi:metal-dependent amidase/aminoacylase/carboxypeptidase family protein